VGSIAGCVFRPLIGDGQVHCGANGSCPPSFTCASDGLCYSGTTSTTNIDAGCTPLHCYVGWCGPIDDGCGSTIDCGSCAVSMPDSGTPPSDDMAGCKPTHACGGGACGTIDDGCGKKLACGDCTVANTCSATTPNSCACVPKTCAAVKATCGEYPDGCGHTLDCFPAGAGSCLQQGNGICGDGGPYTCGKISVCHPLKACPTGACGTIPDGCLDVLNCGNCAAGQVCGGGGTPNVCG
jgi:hypothetical protein